MYKTLGTIKSYNTKYNFQIGQAYDLKTVSSEIIKQRAQRTGDGTHKLWGWDDPEFTEKLKSRYSVIHNEEKKTA